MPNDVTASKMEIIFAKMSRVFKNKSNVQLELRNTPVTAPLLAERQVATLEPLQAGTNASCTGTRIWYSVADNTSEITIGSTAVTSACDIAQGDGVSTVAVDYDFNLFSKSVISLNDDDCDNHYKFDERVAELMMHRQTMIVQGINTKFITELEANKSTPVATDLPDGVTIVLGDYTMTDADYWNGTKTQEALANVMYLADKHGITDYVVLSGRSLQTASIVASFNGGNVGNDKFGNSVAFGESNLYFDKRNLDRVVGDDCLFIVDSRAYASYFYAEYPTTPMEVGDKDGTIKVSVPLRYYNNFDKDNNSTSVFQFFNGTSMQDAYVDVLYQKDCDKTTNKNKKIRLLHNWEYDLTGMFALAPNNGAETGIVKIVKG